MGQFGGISIPGVSAGQLDAAKAALESQITSVTDAVAQGTVPWLQLKPIVVPTLLLGASVDRTVVWDLPAPAVDYALPQPVIVGTAAGNVTATLKAGTKTVSGVTVTISATLAVTLGTAYVLLIAGRSAHQ